ncbi:hypothetical protein [Methylorubrum thiocyanatum]|uniref:Uncharacterized protein n=1 Tax=Methylorubrum thiocyanatum TaxID=47958 RepID=A0AA40S780_9HYPH|nr:hypothetical protein [Methylorubrum thiocyanatum]MBA8915785.1 hypothetical protein [Methylorubrum thiocyanatum]GJE81241.1 hypothetical protein CJNNKLLH_2589 [Methylorubrum thiocyanatum]
MSEGATITAPECPVEERLPRAVTRLIDRDQHREGHHVANFIGDAEVMLSHGEFFGLTERDFRLLRHVLATGIKPASNDEGAEVLMNNRQWGNFVGMRRTYLRAYRDPSNLMAMLKTRFRVASSSQTHSSDTN